MDTVFEQRVNWKAVLALPGFRYLFLAMFVSLFGTGMNFAGVTWYVLEKTNSPVSVSLVTVLVMSPGLVVPIVGGVLIDRVDRRYLGMALDVARGTLVLATAALVASGAARLWHIYAMVFLLGVGFAIYWSTSNALAQEVIPRQQLVAANSAVLIAIQGGMMSAGALVGFVYERAGLGGILTIDGLTYFAAALCLLRLRRGYHAPHAHRSEESPADTPAAFSPARSEEALHAPAVEPEIAAAFLRDVKEGIHYLRGQPRILALGITYSCMMAGVISSNVLLVTLAQYVLKAGARGFGFLEFGWAFGAVSGGLLVGELVRRYSSPALLIAALAILSIGHALFPYAGYLLIAVAMNALFGACRALGGVLTQTSMMSAVPKRLMGRTQSAFALISTLLQVAMSFSLGYLAQHTSLTLAFLALALIYAGAAVSAVRARGLSQPAAAAA
jgi:DHA3 family macrolide efflux protein-like MFS transporter